MFSQYSASASEAGAVIHGMARTKSMAASVTAIYARLVDERLQVDAVVRDATGRQTAARVPDRELAALLPRSILAADGRPAPEVLDTIREIIERLVVGRRVRLWEHRNQRYLGFLSWRTVRFTGEPRSEAQRSIRRTTPEPGQSPFRAPAR